MIKSAHWITWITLLAHGLLSYLFFWSLQAQGRSNRKAWEHALAWVARKMVCLGVLKERDVKTLECALPVLPYPTLSHPAYIWSSLPQWTSQHGLHAPSLRPFDATFLPACMPVQSFARIVCNRCSA